MSDPGRDEKTVSIPKKTYNRWLGTTLFILIIFSTLNFVFSFFWVPKFEQIFQDALPGKPLPLLTEFVLACRIPLAIVALAWPIAGVIFVWRSSNRAILFLNLAIILTLVQIGITIFALFIPMVSGCITSTSDQGLESSASPH